MDENLFLQIRYKTTTVTEGPKATNVNEQCYRKKTLQMITLRGHCKKNRDPYSLSNGDMMYRVAKKSLDNGGIVLTSSA